MKFKKRLFKKISLALLGLGMLGGTVVGVTHLVNHLKQDKESIHPTFEVGGLNAQGRYEEDKSSLYTKEKFACEGLEATLDFDSQITYQLYYYDILDNFISSTAVLRDGYGENAPLNGAYARIEITPTNDDDNKISFVEKIKYANMLNLKVNKGAEGNVNKKFKSLGGNLFEVSNKFSDIVFKKGKFIGQTYTFEDADGYCYTGSSLYNVEGYKKVSVDATKTESISFIEVCCYDKDLKFIGIVGFTNEVLPGPFTANLVNGSCYVTINCWFSNGTIVTSPTINNIFSFEK